MTQRDRSDSDYRLEAFELLRFFDYDHLPEELQPLSSPFFGLAHRLFNDDRITYGPEIVNALEKLLEAKDWAVRSGL